MLKITITGDRGDGATTLAASLERHLRASGYDAEVVSDHGWLKGQMPTWRREMGRCPFVPSPSEPGDGRRVEITAGHEPATTENVGVVTMRVAIDEGEDPERIRRTFAAFAKGVPGVVSGP